MTEAEAFARIDAYEGNTMIVFAEKRMAMEYMAHRNREHGQTGIAVMCEDTRTGSGLVVIWRDRIDPDRMLERLGNCQWLLEEVLAGRYARPEPGAFAELWAGGFPGAK